MILLDRKKPISALKLIHTINHTQVNRFCDINNNHVDIIKPLNYIINKRIYNLKAGLYKITIDGIEYIIDVYFDLSDGDFLIIKSKYDIALYMAGSTRYNIIPYQINSIKDITNPYHINTVNDTIDAIIVTGKTEYSNLPSLNNPAKINRISNINISTESNINSDSLNIYFKHTLGELPNGIKDTVIINSEQLIAHEIINTTKEVLSGGLEWNYIESYSNSEYYVFFTKYPNIKLNNSNDSIRCSHFESVACDELLKESTNKNCIATSYGSYGNGLFIKISASVLDVHGNKNLSVEMKKWILAQAISEYPIYIEYEISNTKYNTFLIKEYHINTWYPNTIFSFNNNYDFSIFYKTFKSS